MTVGLSESFQEIDRACAACSADFDLLALGLLESEIYSNNLQFKEALSSFERYVEPLLSQLGPAEAAVIGDNKSGLLIDAFAGAGEFYHLVDARRILGVQTRDYASVLEARADAAEGKHFDALPTFWQQLRSSYELLNWRAHRLAERDFSEECIQLGWLAEAAYHAMLSGSKEAAEKIAEVLLGNRSSERIGGALKKMLNAAALREHALQTLRVVAKSADAIPDESIESVTSLLLKHAPFEPTSWHDAGLLESTWDAVGAIAHRVDAVRPKLLSASDSGTLF